MTEREQSPVRDIRCVHVEQRGGVPCMLPYGHDGPHANAQGESSAQPSLENIVPLPLETQQDDTPMVIVWAAGALLFWGIAAMLGVALALGVLSLDPGLLVALLFTAGLLAITGVTLAGVGNASRQ